MSYSLAKQNMVNEIKGVFAPLFCSKEYLKDTTIFIVEVKYKGKLLSNTSKLRIRDNEVDKLREYLENKGFKLTDRWDEETGKADKVTAKIIVHGENYYDTTDDVIDYIYAING